MRSGAVFVPGRVPAPQQAVLREVSELLKRRRARAYLVGGLLRDHLAGKPTCDIDLAVAGIAPREVARTLAGRLGLSGPVVYPRFKTVLVAGADIQVEICALEGDLTEDAARRDFTVNCLYLDLASLHSARCPGLLDPTGQALRDLKARLLRTPQDACYTIWLDPLRILRAVRFHATDGFRLDAGLRNAMGRMAYLLTRPAAERIRLELEKILVSPRLPGALSLMQSTGVSAVILPELAGTYGFAQKTPYHSYDLFTHLVKTAALTPPVVELRLAGLLHDIGKLTTQMPKGDRMVYYGHEDVSREVAASVVRRLRFSNRAAGLVTFLAGNHMVNYSCAWSDRAVRRFAHRMGRNLTDVLTLAEADRRAQRRVRAAELGVWDLRRRIREIEGRRGPGCDLPVDGRDIMRILGIKQGPLVGEAKAFLLEEALKKPGRITEAEAVEMLERWGRARSRRARSIHVDKPARP
jgi:putative nucleotidyltransferase with HDIG domain